MIKAPDIITDRLWLREIKESDSDTIVRLRSNQDAYRFFAAPHIITKEEHLNWFKNKYLKDKNRIDWMGFNSNNDRVGVFGVKKPLRDSDQAEVSYILNPMFYGHGYASEAVRCLIKYCRDDWNVSTVIAEIHKNNVRSIVFATRLGFAKTSVNGDFIIYSISLGV